MKKRIKMILTIIITFAFFIPNVHAANLLTGTGNWESFFNEWFQSEGTITSTTPNGFTIDASSIGTYQWPSSDFGFGAQAKLFNKSISLTKGKFYTYNATIKSDKDRKIFIKITDIEKNPETNQYEDIANVMLEKWVTLQAGVEYNLNETFMATSNIKRISMYYAIGFNGQDSAAVNSANKIEVNNINIDETNVNIKDLEHTTLQKNSVNTKYSYNNIFGIQTTEIVDYKGQEQLKLTLNKDNASSIKVNSKSVALQKDGYIVYIPISELDNEYNDVIVYAKSRFEGKEMILARTSVINSNIPDYRNQKINEVSQYENNNNSDKQNSLIEKAKRDIENAASKTDIDKIFNTFKNQYYGKDEINTIPLTGNSKEEDVNNNPLTKDNILFYFITLLFGIIGLRLVTKVTRKN